MTTLSDPRGIWVKVCGVTRPADADAAAAAGVSAIGLMFARSRRRVTVAQAGDVRAAIPPGVAAVGIFDDEWSAESVAGVVRRLALDGVQVQARAPVPDGVAPIVLRTIRVRVAADLACAAALRATAVHVDAFVEGQLGGTGHLAPWDEVAAAALDVPFVLSGGLAPDNVAEAVRRLRPAGVDVSSGVESAPGVKDGDAVRAFVVSARTAT